MAGVGTLAMVNVRQDLWVLNYRLFDLVPILANTAMAFVLAGLAASFALHQGINTACADRICSTGGDSFAVRRLARIIDLAAVHVRRQCWYRACHPRSCDQ